MFDDLRRTEVLSAKWANILVVSRYATKAICNPFLARPAKSIEMLLNLLSSRNIE
jgi:hypothetical protein